MIKTNIFTYKYSMPLNVVITLKGFLNVTKNTHRWFEWTQTQFALLSDNELEDFGLVYL